MSKHFMFRKLLILSVVTLGAFSLTSCHRGRVQNPLANLDSKQPDKVLFDRAMEAGKKGKYEVQRTILQTLINTYPDSEYISRAKLAVGDSWYAEGGSTGLAQAEIEYKDFITFFPNVPEAAEAQLRVADIHYRQMEKPDRDYTHARRAEEEYRNLVLQFPDSKLVPQAKQQLLQVQEVLGEREFRVGRFYFLRESWPAAIARLKTLTDTYPLYSQADAALYMLGTAYEHEIQLTRAAKGINEVQKATFLQELTHKAADAYSQIVTRYPVMPAASEAKIRLQALGRPVPTATPEAIAQNKAEEESRGETGRIGKVMGNFRKAPNVSQSAKVGEPNLSGSHEASAPEFVRQAQATMLGKSGSQGNNTVSVETVGKGAPPQSQPIPKSAPADQVQDQKPPSETGIPELKPQESNPPQDTPAADPKPQADNAPATAPKPPAAEQKSSSSSSSDTSSTQSPTQVNDAQAPGPQSDTAEASEPQKAQAATSAPASSDDKNTSSSKKKKKKGLRKIVPF